MKVVMYYGKESNQYKIKILHNDLILHVFTG